MIKYNTNISINEQHPFHLVKSSLWPFSVPLSIGNILICTVFYLHSYYVKIIFFSPGFSNLYSISWIGQRISFIRVAILSIGLIYEMKVGALSWYPKPWLENQ